LSAQRSAGAERELRLLAAVLFGCAAALVVGWFGPWQLTVLVAWIGFVAAYMTGVWRKIWRLDPSATAEAATRQDDSRGETRRLLLTIAALASLGGAAIGVLKARTEGGPLGNVLGIATVATVLASWALIHTIYALHYARLYYVDEDGGIDFPGDEKPDYRDFAYVAFTVGMTYQVSDTNIDSRLVRRSLLGHSLLSYLFGTVIIAVTINLVAGLIH